MGEKKLSDLSKRELQTLEEIIENDEVCLRTECCELIHLGSGVITGHNIRVYVYGIECDVELEIDGHDFDEKNVCLDFDKMYYDWSCDDCGLRRDDDKPIWKR